MRKIIIVIAVIAFSAAVHFVLRPAVPHISSLTAPPIEKATETGAPEASATLGDSAPVVKRPSPMTDNGYFVNEAKEACFKLVVISYSGAVKWLENIAQTLAPGNVSEFVPGQGADAWTLSALTIAFPRTKVDGHPVRLFVFAHEGIGFIGQPKSAKDAVYKNARAVIALGDTGEIEDLKAVLDADIGSFGKTAARVDLFFFSPAPSGAPERTSPKDSFHRWVDWKQNPPQVLDIVFEKLFAGAEAGDANER